MAPKTGPPTAKPTTPPKRPAVNSTVSSFTGTMAVVFTGAAGGASGAAGAASSDMKMAERLAAARLKEVGAKADADPTTRAETRRVVYLTMVLPVCRSDNEWMM
mmetsp:Transcript_12000/g.24204  ORF Transcript_12000/g.24204 Transcript_12000/m.24204 type:complete len:104 (-) Transcript_12000:52-363(-)